MLPIVDDHRPPDRAAALGRRPHRDGVRLPGHRHLARRGDRGPRLPGAPGRDPLRRDRLRARQPRSSTSRTRFLNPRIRLSADVRRRDRGRRARARAGRRRALERGVAPAAPQPGRDRRLRARRDSSSSSRVFAPLHRAVRIRATAISRARRTLLPGPVARSTGSGIDELGRDELSRIVYGARYSLLIGVVSVAVGLSIGARARRDRRLLRRVGRQRDHAPDGHHARDPGPAARDRDRRDARPGHLPDHDRGRGRATSRSSRGCCAARCSRSARTTSCSRRARSASRAGRSSSSHILPNAISPVIVAGDAGARDGDHRRRRPRLPRARPAGPVDARVGHDAHRREALPQTAPHLAIIPGHRDRDRRCSAST